MFVTPAYAQAAGGAAAGITQFVPLILIFVMVSALRRGDQIVTQGGLIAKVVKVKDDNEVEAEIADGVKVRVVRQTITQVLNKTEPANEG
jgi:preprotein translocase subunit YajC